MLISNTKFLSQLLLNVIMMTSALVLSKGNNFVRFHLICKDVEEVRAICKGSWKRTRSIVAKLKKQQGIDNLDKSSEAADGIMIAREQVSKYRTKWFQFTKK